MLIQFDVFTHNTGNVILNLITCGEMVLCAIAQSYSFSYSDFIQGPITPLKTHMVMPKGKNHNLCDTISRVLFSTRDVLDDAQRTFINEDDDEVGERET